MKKTVKTLVIGVIAAIGVFAVSGAALAYNQYTQTDMNFRNGPSTTATIIGSVPAGAQVDVQGSENGWDKVVYNGQTGFIHGGNVADTYTAPAPAQTAQTGGNYASVRDYFDNNFVQAAKNLPEAQDGLHRVVVNDGYLALRSAPTYDASNEIGKLYTGDVVERLDGQTYGSYIRVYSAKLGASGYVNAGFVQ